MNQLSSDNSHVALYASIAFTREHFQKYILEEFCAWVFDLHTAQPQILRLVSDYGDHHTFGHQGHFFGSLEDTSFWKIARAVYS